MESVISARALTAVRTGDSLFRPQGNGKAKVRRIDFPLFSNCRNHVTFVLGMLHIDHVIIGSMSLQTQDVGTEILGNIYLAAGKGPVSKGNRTRGCSAACQLALRHIRFGDQSGVKLQNRFGLTGVELSSTPLS